MIVSRQFLPFLVFGCIDSVYEGDFEMDEEIREQKYIRTAVANLKHEWMWEVLEHQKNIVPIYERNQML